MPELMPQERLQPALLDRLTDDEPGKTQEPPERRVMSKGRLREAVLRDLAWLFNATRLESNMDMSRAPAARRSVINFGLPAFSGRCATCTAAWMLAPDEMPTSSPSSAATRRAIANDCSFVTVITSSMMPVLSTPGTKPAPIP